MPSFTLPRRKVEEFYNVRSQNYNDVVRTGVDIEDQQCVYDTDITTQRDNDNRHQQLSLPTNHDQTGSRINNESSLVMQTYTLPPTPTNTATNLEGCSVSSQDAEILEIRQSRRTSLCIVLLGLATSAAFFALGISSLKDTEQENFDRFGYDLYNKLNSALNDYIFASSMIHIQCRSRNFTRQDFRNLYEYIIADGLDVKAIDFKPKVFDTERTLYENEAREYYAMKYPHINYEGFTGLNYDNSTIVEPRVYSDVYYPVHYIEPVQGNERAIDLDFYASGSRRLAIDECVRTGQPTISDRLKLVQETVDVAYGVVILHPGVNVTSPMDVWPRDLASVVVRIPDLLRRSTSFQAIGANVYLFDKLDDNDVFSSLFLGGVQVKPYKELDTMSEFSLLPDITVSELAIRKNLWYKDFYAANKIWCLVIEPVDGAFEPQFVFIILGGFTIVLASVFLAYSVHNRTHRIIQCNKMKRQSELEKAALILDNAKQSAKSERELNDFIAHEVRNPVAAAMAACSLVQRTTNMDHSKLEETSWNIVKGDVQVISNALFFINDLLRNMLDMHRATSQQLVVNLVSVDTGILHDILEPVQSILYLREQSVHVHIECGNDIFAIADKLRLKQVLINLGRNSTKFVQKGFIRFCAKKVTINNNNDINPTNDSTNDDDDDNDNELIEFAVEDSGPGIPIEKRESMFRKYQDSLDGLAQGTVRERMIRIYFVLFDLTKINNIDIIFHGRGLDCIFVRNLFC
jgi:signal transduction histidine kinase